MFRSANLYVTLRCPNCHCERSEMERGNLKIKERSPRLLCSLAITKKNSPKEGAPVEMQRLLK
jgi:hypothetical protein